MKSATTAKKDEKTVVGAGVLTNESTLGDAIRDAYMNLPVSVLCARYWYRGMLRFVGKDWLVLSDPRAVEVTGPACAESPATEDPIPGDLYLDLNAVEMVSQPYWAWWKMPIQLPETVKKGIEEFKKQQEEERKRREAQEKARKQDGDNQ